jgi:rhodanese-related sulfurtransferase
VDFLVQPQNLFLVAVALVSGAMLLWPMFQRATGGAVVGTLQATRLINDGAVVVDVRDPAEYAAGHLADSRNIPAAQIAGRAGELPANKPVIVICASGSRATRAAAALRRAGRSDVYCLDGGLAGWQQAGLPVRRKA